MLIGSAEGGGEAVDAVAEKTDHHEEAQGRLRLGRSEISNLLVKFQMGHSRCNF